MSDINNELDPDQLKQPIDIKQLDSKYENLSREVKQLESNKTAIIEDLKQIHGEFEQIDTNIEEILLKLNKLSDVYEKTGNYIPGERDIAHSMKKVFAHPLRKIAVGTLTAVYAITDKAIEKASTLREDIEDIVAEAQYSNKEKKMPSVDHN